MRCNDIVIAHFSVLLGGLIIITALAQEKLLFGYKLQSDVAAYLDLANHVREIRRAPSIEDEMKIYTNDTASVSLQSLSTSSWELWKNVPIYNVYVSSFQHMGVSHGAFQR